MAIAVHIFQTLEDYSKQYPIGSDDMSETPISGIFCNSKGFLALTVEVAKISPKHTNIRSINIELGGRKKLDETEWSELHDGDIMFNYKKKKLVIKKDSFVSIIHQVDRYYGNEIKKSNVLFERLSSGNVIVNNRYVFYDIGRNCVNFILIS